MTRFAALFAVLFIASPVFPQALNAEDPKDTSPRVTSPKAAPEEPATTSSPTPGDAAKPPSGPASKTTAKPAANPASAPAAESAAKPPLGPILGGSGPKSKPTTSAPAVKLTAGPARAAAQGTNPVSVSTKLEPSQLKPGQTAKLSITAKIEPGWHLYALTQPAPPRAAKVTIDESGVFKLDGAVQQPKPKTYKDPNFSQPGEPPFMSQAFENEVTFTAPIKVAADAQPGAQKLIAKFSYQACDDQTCLRPTTKTLEIETTIAAASVKTTPSPSALKSSPAATPSQIGFTSSPANAKPEAPTPKATAAPEATPEPTPEPSPTPSATPAPIVGQTGPGKTPPGPSDNVSEDELAKQLKNRGLFGFIGFAILQGFLALLTPCVFPMIPITVSFFTKRDQKTSGAAVGQAAFFSSGIIFTYTALGLALAAFAGPSGLNKLGSSAWMNLLLTLLFVLFALNLFGMFEIKIPSGLVSKLDAKAQTGQGGTTFATILMGITFTLTSSGRS
jgi:thiol:disulfide interchange protein DsbD